MLDGNRGCHSNITFLPIVWLFNSKIIIF